MPVHKSCEYFKIRILRRQVDLRPLDVLSESGEVLETHHEKEIDWGFDEFHFFKMDLKEGSHPEEVSKEYDRRGLKPIYDHEFVELVRRYPTLFPCRKLANQSVRRHFDGGEVVSKRSYKIMMSSVADNRAIVTHDLLSYGDCTFFFVGRKIASSEG